MWIGLSFRILSLVCIALQAALLDWYLVYYGGSNEWLAWIAADVCVLAVHIASFVYADIYFQQNQYEKLRAKEPEEAVKARRSRQRRRLKTRNADRKTANSDEKIRLENGAKKRAGRQDSLADYEDVINWNNVEEDVRVANLKIGKIRTKYKLGALPLAYVSWTLYAVVLVAKMLVIFLTFGEKLDVHALFGSNMLELAFAMTAAIFALLVSGHKSVPKDTHQKPVIKWMQHHVMLDMLDSVELMEYLYENSGEHHHRIDFAVQNAVLSFISIQILLPSVGLYQLSATNFAHKDPPAYWSMVQQMLSMLFGNIPFLVIRIYLITQHEFTESSFIFIIKNVYGVITTVYEFVQWLRLVKAASNNGNVAVPGCEESDSDGGE